MKTMKQTFLVVLLIGNGIFAQPDRPKYVTVTTLHWNMDNENYEQKEWLAIEKEYLDKVVKKNEFIREQRMMTHYFTADNTGLLFVTSYDSWEAIEKASARSEALEKLAWPDEKGRKAFFEKREAFYDPMHSDEIYETFPGAKQPDFKSDKPLLYYIRKSHWAYPKDGTEKEFGELRNAYLTAVTNKNEFVKAYYPLIHGWGSNKTEFVEVFVMESLGDIEKSFARNTELDKASWSDDGKRKDFYKKYDKYFTGVHGDYIYTIVPELTK